MKILNISTFSVNDLHNRVLDNFNNIYYFDASNYLLQPLKLIMRNIKI